ncbi:amidohydrolase 2 [Coprinopsis marcescibilis]|uniref:Amidohydrolase 2 n=1 Tax=Coprinopsis marcescibilis TaxID=230819 RepID=A0A5C3KHJ5_COPMA|nr:amidohydrolase 2 [Coprinopsis marcescibilis]
MTGGRDRYRFLHRTVFQCPAIDNHCHPLLLGAHCDAFPFEGLISEAHGDALEDSVNTIACLRASKELASLFGLQKGTNWDEIKAHRRKLDYSDLCQLSFQGTNINCLLLDDGLGGVETMAGNYQWHDQFTENKSKRIVRIETVAETIIESIFSRAKPNLGQEPGPLEPKEFEIRLGQILEEEAQHPDVAGFKSVVCYRTGLDVSSIHGGADFENAFILMYESYLPGTPVRLQDKALNDFVVRLALTTAGRYKKPVQFHTGLGDNDLNINLATPSLLQPLIKAYPETTFVLLHAAYPFTREAGYLTSVYHNVYLDWGEIFPMVSRRGQEAALKQVLELCPTNKILWSSDGHWWPESFYLGINQARSALFNVLQQLIEDDDLSEVQAAKVAQNTLFHNANRLYNLNLAFPTEMEIK